MFRTDDAQTYIYIYRAFELTALRPRTNVKNNVKTTETIKVSKESPRVLIVNNCALIEGSTKLLIRGRIGQKTKHKKVVFKRFTQPCIMKFMASRGCPNAYFPTLIPSHSDRRHVVPSGPLPVSGENSRTTGFFSFVSEWRKRRFNYFFF